MNKTLSVNKTERGRYLTSVRRFADALVNSLRWETIPEKLIVPEDSMSAKSYPEPLTLDRIPFGSRARVLSVKGSGGSLRLMEMGIVPGAPVSLVRTAPLGDPIQVQVRDYHLALRRVDASTISVVIAD